MTPESDASTHYFVCGTRSDRVDDIEYPEHLRSMLANAFLNEDRPMIEAQQAAIVAANTGFRPVALAVDQGVMLVRRELDKRIARENGGLHEPSSSIPAGTGGPYE
jgi:vanillate O-demethylase monooxygenase subunit